MKRNAALLPSVLAALLCLALLTAVILHTLVPQFVFPRLDIPMVTLFCLLSLLLEHWLAGEVRHSYPALAVLGALNFGLLPCLASLMPWQRGALMALLGGVVLPVSAWLFASLRNRQQRSATALWPVVTALCLYLAVQAFCGVLR